MSYTIGGTFEEDEVEDYIEYAGDYEDLGNGEPEPSEISVKAETNVDSNEPQLDCNDDRDIQYDDMIIKEEEDWCKDLVYDVYKEDKDTEPLQNIKESVVDSGTQSPISCDLKKNMLKRPSVKKFPCTLCNKQYKSKSTYKEHMVSHNLNGTYKCELCDKQFHWKSSLKYHMLQHNNVKPFVCKLCNKQFKYKYSYNYHMKMHYGEGTYKCELCDKLFPQRSHLKQHMVKHTSDKPFVCTLCNKQYKYKFKHKAHMKSHNVKGT